MKFLHIILPSKRMMGTYIEMIRKYYPVNEHAFYIIGNMAKSEESLFQYQNVIKLNKGKNIIEKTKNLYNDFSKYDVLIWHGLVVSPKIALFLFINRKFLKKSVWVMWGIDLYLLKRAAKGLKDNLINYLNKNIRKNIMHVVAIFPTDIQNYKKIIKNNSSKIYYAPYPISQKGFFELENKNEKADRTNGEIWIQIGNNANSFNNHLEILEELRRYKDEKIKIFIPMSYGNDWHNKVPNYKEIVKSKAIEYFGKEKVVVLRNLMNNDEYNEFLSQMDIIIIATDRQNALGNILKVMYSGGKVYLSEKNSLYKFFNEKDIFVEKFENIKNMTFFEFIKQRNNFQFKQWMIENYYPDSNILLWNAIFNNFDKKSSLQNEIYNKLILDIPYIANFIKDNAQVIEKKNYLNLSRYIYIDKNINKKFASLHDLIVVGTDRSSIKIISALFNINKANYKFHIIGIIDNELYDLGDNAHGYNTIGTINNYKIKSKDVFINFCDNPLKREEYFEDLRKKEAVFATIKLNNVSVGSNVKFEEAYYLGSNSVIGFNTVLGKFVKIGNNTIIGCNCVIGNFVTIGDNCIIKDDTVIEDYKIIESGSVWR